MFLNLSNHPIASWGAEQLAAARALDHGDPREPARPMPHVDPALDEAGVGALAREVADAAVAEGARGAFVAGDFTFTFALVAALRARGVRCYAATTARDVAVEAAPDGAAVKRSVFRFVRWREYVGPE